MADDRRPGRVIRADLKGCRSTIVMALLIGGGVVLVLLGLTLPRLLSSDTAPAEHTGRAVQASSP